MSTVVSVETTESVAVVRIDDGKANALSPDVLAAIDAAVSQAAERQLALLLVGREERFSAGFDLAVMGRGGKAGVSMVRAGGQLSLRLGRHPAPVVVACGGHALAMGAVLLLSADLRIGARGSFKIGFNEVAIGTGTPLFLLEQARERLSKRHFHRATAQAEIYGPDSAVDAGFLDRCVDPGELYDVALAEAQRLAALPREAFVETRSRARSATLQTIEATMAEDIAGLFGMT